MNKLLSCLIPCFIFIACSTLENQDYKPLFKYGTYKHEILISLSDRNDIKLLGYNKFSKNAVQLVALSPFGTTVISYNKTGDDIDIFYDKKMIKLTELKMNVILSSIADFYKLKMDICEDYVCKHTIYGENVYFLLDVDNNVSKIESSYKNIKIDIKVTSHEKA